jgi:hypothetical protein
MKKYNYSITTLSSLIVSPRGSNAFYSDLKGLKGGFDNEKIQLREIENINEKKNPKSINIIFPFYQYGEYNEYVPETARYYLPGSTIKGAIKGGPSQRYEKKESLSLMMDDILIDKDKIFLDHLYKIQKKQSDLELPEDKQEYELDIFFTNQAVEMVGMEEELKGELYTSDISLIENLLKKTNDTTRKKISQMLKQLDTRRGKDKFNNYCNRIKQNLENLKESPNIILMGGYKGLRHSIILNNSLLQDTDKEIQSGIYIDMQAMLPNGLVKFELL